MREQFEGPVKVSAEVLKGIEAVRESGKTNMFITSMVAALAMSMGHMATAMWVTDNYADYAHGILYGFEVAN